MCSRLHVQLSPADDSIVRVGDPVPFCVDGQTWMGFWGTKNHPGARPQGFAREETMRRKWLQRGWKPCTIPLAETGFAEGHETQRWANTGEVLVAALCRSARVRYPDAQGTPVEVVVITRQATAAERRKLDHHRVPVQVVDHRMVLPSKGGADWTGKANQA